MSLANFFRPRPVDQRFPSIAAMERVAARRIPKFAHDYMAGGIGREVGLGRNVQALDAVRLLPKYLTECPAADLSTTLWGHRHAAPFAPSPVGLTGLMWPDAPLHIARAAGAHGLPMGLSTYATCSLEEAAAACAPGPLWFQLYPQSDPEIEADLLKRFRAIGGEVLLVTVDIPQNTRRERDLGNGLSVPPRQDLRTYLQAAARPRWALATLRHGLPEFRNITRYLPVGRASSMELLSRLNAGHVTPERLRRYRDDWPGKLVVKGVLHLDDVRTCLDAGVDGIVVSNHGGRQLDAAPAAPEVLPQIRQLAAGRLVIMADGGVRTGLDIARMIAKGADFVLLGRALALSVAALGPHGPSHALKILTEEFAMTLSQLGCSDWRDLPKFLQE